MSVNSPKTWWLCYEIFVRFKGRDYSRQNKTTRSGGDGIVNLALDTGATWTLVSWEISVQRGYDPASVRERTPGNDGERGRILSEDKSETFAGYGKVGFERGCFVSHFAAD